MSTAVRPTCRSLPLAVLAASIGLLSCTGCRDVSPPAVGGDPERGRALIRSYGCGSCHSIPGVPGANGRVGPPLRSIGRRGYIGGVLPNTPAHMIRWIESPESVDPLTAMPDLGVPADEAADMTAYLYRLE